MARIFTNLIQGKIPASAAKESKFPPEKKFAVAPLTARLYDVSFEHENKDGDGAERLRWIFAGKRDVIFNRLRGLCSGTGRLLRLRLLSRRRRLFLFRRRHLLLE
jgi:hypothetical protein